MARDGHQVTVFCREGESTLAGVRVRRIPQGPEGGALLLSELPHYQTVFVHNVLTMPFAPAWTEALWQLASAHPRTRWVSWIHDLAATNPHYEIPKSSLLRQSSPHFLPIAISAHRAQEFQELTGTPCQVIPNGIDPEALLELTPAVAKFTDRYQLFQRSIVLLQPARLLPRKNVGFSLEVAHALKNSGKSCALLVTGAPDAQNAASLQYATRLLELRDQMALQDTAFFLNDLFPVGAKDLAALYRLSDAVLFPSLQEGFGLPLLEAALHRIPLICPNTPPLGTLIPEGGLRYPPESTAADLACSLVALLEQKPQNQARKSVLQNYCWDILYQTALSPLLEP
jgi:glycosyltransferase involved in cell wall biosynthesis